MRQELHRVPQHLVRQNLKMIFQEVLWQRPARYCALFCISLFFQIISCAKVGPQVGELVRDVRKLMGPYTANNLREKR